MKIAILTVPFNNNYGGFLQAFALKRVLKGMGHDVEFLMRRRYRPSRFARFKNFIKWTIGRTNHCSYLTDYHIYKISKNTRQFVCQYLSPLTKSCYTPTSFKKLMDKYQADVFIAGSDQCWRYKFAPNYIDDYFFKPLLGTNKRRISYAASLGVDYLEFDEAMIKTCEKCLKEFSAISVRETSGIYLLENNFNVPKGKTVEVLDPTMLLTVDVYKELIDKYKITNKNYLFTYILDEDTEKEKAINLIKQELHLDRIDQKAQTGDVMKLQEIEPVELWLSRIYHSSFVITDSYHGMVFSILFKKPFIVYGNAARGKTRFMSVLSKFGLEDRYIENTKNIDKYLINNNIDWNKTHDLLQHKRVESLAFLSNALIDYK